MLCGNGDVGESFLDFGCLLCHSVTVSKPVVKRSYNSRLAFDCQSNGDRLALTSSRTPVGKQSLEKTVLNDELIAEEQK